LLGLDIVMEFSIYYTSIKLKSLIHARTCGSKHARVQFVRRRRSS
jgi:hypothetical protein